MSDREIVVNGETLRLNSRSVIVGTDGDGRRVDVYLANRFPNFSRSSIQRLIQQGGIERVNGDLKPSSTLAAGQELLVTSPGIGPSGPPPPLPDVMYEDERLLVVSKPSGMLAHPAGLTFTYGLVGVARAARPDHDVDLAHRLDRETSGINVLTKDKAANSFLKNAFYKKLPSKTYHAIVYGSPDWEQTKVDAPIGHAAGSSIRIRRGVAADGLPAQTTVSVLQRMENFSLVEACPHTGRTHQIRVHLEHLGLPILGDKMYGQPDDTFTHMLDHGPDEKIRKATGFPRHALHAAKITIPHPDGEWVTIEAPLPTDMKAIVDGKQPCWPDPDE